ncbi:MAG: dipeptide ABC transporter ATP-binding protein [Rhizobiaceae bacterium]
MGEPAKDMLRIKDLRVSIAVSNTEIEVVKGASFRVPSGKTVCLVGESGSGKSIIAQAIMGILPKVARISGGSIDFDDPMNDDPPIDIAKLDRNGKELLSLRGGRISIIFQEPMTSLSPVHTIGNQIEEALLLHRDTAQREARNMTEQMLRLVGFPDPHRAYDMYPMELSGGLRQRAMIAMALICHPALLIADEPTTALDVTIQAQVLAVLKDLQKKLGMSLLLITHDLGVVANMADEVVVIYHGEIMEAGTVEEIFTNPQHEYLQALLAAVPRLKMEPGEKLRALREIDEELPASMIRRELPGADAPPLLSARNLTKTYHSKKGGGPFGGGSAGVRAVNNVSFDLVRGECFGLVGESGCGKSSLSKLICRALTADHGSITFDNGSGPIDIGKLRGKELERFRTRIQMVFQDPFSSLSPRSTILNTLREPMEIHDIGDRQWRRKWASELLRMVGLPKSSMNRYPHSFSGGQRQRIGIARALAVEPDLLVCDEPVSALDVSVQAQILNLLTRLRKELGLTSIFISHNLAVVNYVADRVAVMYAGRIVEIAPPSVLFDNPVHPYTQRLISAIPTIELDRKLDLDTLRTMEENEEDSWQAEFRIDPGDTETVLEPISKYHYVLRKKGTNAGRRAA